MRWRRCAVWLVAFGMGCGETERAEPPARSAQVQAGQRDPDDLQRRIVVAIAEARQRLGLAAGDPVGRGKRPCSDEQLGREPGTSRIVPVVRVRDERLVQKNLIPLEVLGRLETDEFAVAASHLSGGRAALWDPEAARPLSFDRGRAALAELERLRQTRYAAEIRIVTYLAPHLFRRKGKLRSEWHAGILAFDLALYDLSEGRLLCQTSAVVRGDASDAPIRRRLRERTRLQLQRSLADRTWQKAREALGEISERFEFPPDERRTEPSYRWSSGPVLPGPKSENERHTS